MRTFIAIEIPEDIRQGLETITQALRKHRLPVRWVSAQNTHLTLKFLGEVGEATLARVQEAMEETAALHAPVSLSVRGLGAFPSMSGAKVLWAGINGDVPELAALAETLEDALGLLGFSKEKRRFAAHLTLGRAKERLDGRALAQAYTACGDIHLGPFTATELVLFKSDLKPTGAVYTALCRAALSGAQGGEHGGKKA
jgi:2'-5' RNA ligase